MLQAETFAQLGFASLMKADFNSVAENYAKAVDLAIKTDPKSEKIGEWYSQLCSGLYASQNYKELKNRALAFAKYGKEHENYKNLESAYGYVANAIYYTPDYDEAEYQKYQDLESEAKKKAAEEEDLSNPMLNSIKTKIVLLGFDPESKINKTYTNSDLEEALKVDAVMMLSDPNYTRNMEKFAEQIISSLQVIKVKSPNSAAEGKAWGGLAVFAYMTAAFLSFDTALADFGEKCFEKGRVILEKVDRLGNDLIALVGLGAGYLNSYPTKKALKDKYESMKNAIMDENMRLAKEKEKNLNKKLVNLEEAKDDMNSRLSKVETEQKELGEKFEKLQSNVNMVQEKMTSTTEKLKELAQQKENIEDMTLLNSILEKEKALIGKKQAMKKIAESQDLSDYYNSMMQDLEAIYIGARAAASGKLEVSKSSSFSDAAGFAAGFINMIPIMGGAISSIVSGVASVADSYLNSKDNVGLVNIGDIAPNIGVFDEFVEEIVLAFLKKNEAQIVALQGAKINNKDWKELLKTAVTGGIGGFFEKIMSENDSKAKLRGKADSTKIINYLEKGFIKIKPGDIYGQYVQWVLEEKNFKTHEKSEVQKTKHKKKTTGCFCFGKKRVEDNK